MNRLFLILTALVASVSVANATEYLQASSSVTQCPGTAPEVVAMDIIDAADGISMANNQLTVSEAGPYLIFAAPQAVKVQDPSVASTCGCASTAPMSPIPTCSCARMPAAWPRMSLFRRESSR